MNWVDYPENYERVKHIEEAISDLPLDECEALLERDRQSYWPLFRYANEDCYAGVSAEIIFLKRRIAKLKESNLKVK